MQNVVDVPFDSLQIRKHGELHMTVGRKPAVAADVSHILLWNDVSVFVAGVFWESGVQARRSEALPDAGDPRHGSVRAVEDGPLQELHAQRPGGPGSPHSGPGAALDTGVPCAEVSELEGLTYIWLQSHVVSKPQSPPECNISKKKQNWQVREEV